MTQTLTNEQAGVSRPLPDTTTNLTRRLLACGVVAGRLFIIVALLQVLFRQAFDLRRHPLSLLSLGDLGWIQIGNFVVTGSLTVAFAVGMRRVLHPGRGGTWGPLLVGTYGVGLIAGGVFVADPSLGFPPGAPEGIPDQLSWHAILHGFAPAVALLSLIAACFVFVAGLPLLPSGAGLRTARPPGSLSSASWRGPTKTRSACSWQSR